MENEKIYFFGAGKVGKRCLGLCRVCGYEPDGFLDNSKRLWGTDCEGVPVYPPMEAAKQENARIYITCAKWKSILAQLLEQGIEKKNVIYDNNVHNQLVYLAMKRGVFKQAHFKQGVAGKGETILIDLENGMVLGGVEAWSYTLAGMLKGKGYAGKYIVSKGIAPAAADHAFSVSSLPYRDDMDEKTKLDLGIREIIGHLPCIVVCNFPWYTFKAACIAKQLYPEYVRVVAVQHNDEEMYYDSYCLWQDFIDKCLVISSRMKKKQLASGMDPRLLGELSWEIPCDQELGRTWSPMGSPIRIGYAGRVTVEQKRSDLLLLAAKGLRDAGLDFQMDIAGVGDYLETLKRQVQEEGLRGQVRFLGLVERTKIPGFWKEQDIMVSCSDWEGHSISQMEAMAAGAVPIATDVSGVRDDVSDGENGFVVPVGDVQAIIEKIICLSQNRDILRRMGMKAHSCIYEGQMRKKQQGFWTELLSAFRFSWEGDGK